MSVRRALTPAAVLGIALGITLAGRTASAEPCSTATECTSGFCVDGVCCDTACDGVCEACNLEGTSGTCTPVVGAPKHGSCTAAPSGEPCKARHCDGVTRASCEAFAAASVTCAPRSCVDGRESAASTCDAMGGCVAATPVACGAYACDGDQCRLTCRSDVDCAAGFRCDTVTSKCQAGDTCDGDHTITTAEGKKDCAPYRCEKSACKPACSSSSDCTAGNVCDGRSCVAQLTAAAGEDEGGCAFGVRPSRASLAMLLVLGALGAWRRRRPG